MFLTIFQQVISLHALMTHIKILHKALQWSDCNDCKAISSDVDEDMLTDQKISFMTLKKIKEHIKVLHRSEKSQKSGDTDKGRGW